MSEAATIAPVRKSVFVACSSERAWEVYTKEVDAWWPTSTHAVNPGRVREVVLEPREGGEMYEVGEDGGRDHWARVLTWEPPRRLVLAWFVNPEMPAPTEIEVTFTPEEDGTRVEVEHRGWERLGEVGAEKRSSYDEGWEPVLEAYRARAS